MRRYHKKPVNNWFTPECENMRNECMSLKNKISDVLVQSLVLCSVLYAQYTNFIEYKKLTRKAKRKYEIQFHNKLRTMKSENYKDYWAVLNRHSPNNKSTGIDSTLNKFLKLCSTDILIMYIVITQLFNIALNTGV